jgi:hypothetical protein
MTNNNRVIFLGRVINYTNNAQTFGIGKSHLATNFKRLKRISLTEIQILTVKSLSGEEDPVLL